MGDPILQPELTTYDQWEQGDYARFAELYPAAKTLPEFWTALCRALIPQQIERLLHAALPWHPSSVVFQDVAHWARLEWAHADSVARRAQGVVQNGLTIPYRTPMPGPLGELLGEKPKKSRKARAK